MTWWTAPVFAGISVDLRDRFEAAQAELDWLLTATGRDLVFEAATRLGLDPRVSERLDPDLSALQVGDLSHTSLVETFRSGFPEGTSIAMELADEVQLVRAFADPDAALARIEATVERVVGAFPTAARHIQVGSNRGDVLDPYLLAANFELINPDQAAAISSTISHKILMKIEDMVGRMHEDTLGAMRGNFRVPEPQASPTGNKNVLHASFNPFPGADVGQVPIPDKPNKIRLFQCKAKTGSAKGGDGVRIGQQLALLGDTYGADTFFAAIVGNTLSGHRSKGAVLRASPTTAVLVGDAALRELTRSSSGAELLLRSYRRAFRTIAARSGYSFQDIATTITAEFESIAGPDEDLVDAWLHEAMSGDPADQDSREA